MSRISLRLAAVLALFVTASSCNESTVAPVRQVAKPAFDQISSADLGQTINALIPQLFPNGLVTASSVQWSNITEKLAEGDSANARSKLANLISFIQGKTGDIAAPEGETQEHAAARLILYMSQYVYGGSSAPVPQMGTDAAVAVIDPGSETTLVTPNQYAGIKLPAGAVSVPTVLVIYEDANQVWAPCSGPLNTTLCQYPHFYHFDIFPHVRLNTAAKVGVCHVLSGPNAPLRDPEHDGRLRVAHNAPADAADYTPDAQQVDGIEILPLTDISDFLICSQTETASSLNSHRSNSLADRGWRALDKLASAAKWLVVPKTAYAIDQGGGGMTLEFSTFEVVDPVPSDVTPPVVTPNVTGTSHNDWYTSDIGISWIVVDNESAITSPPCASSSVTSDTNGITFTCSATSAGGTATGRVTVKRDATPPVITYTGNASTYTVDQTVAITCSALDAMSGLAGSTCQDISGDAYTFGLGTHSYSASATDNAGNSSTKLVSFSVEVTPASLCALTRRFSSNAGVASALCAKLTAYQASIARGSSTSAAGQLRAYINQVNAQTGKAIPSAKAAILISLAGAL